MHSLIRPIPSLWQAVLAILLLTIAPLGAQGQYSYRSWQTEDGLPVNLVRSIVQSSDGHLWVATADGIARFDGIDFLRVAPPAGFDFPPSGPNRLFATKDGLIWFSSHHGGLLRINGQSAEAIWPDGPPSDLDQVTQLIDHPEGGALLKRGDTCFHIPPSEKPVAIDTLPENLSTLLEENLTQRTRSGRIGPDGKPGPLVDRGGSIWTVTSDGSLLVTSPEGFERQMAIPGTGTDANVAELLEDSEGNVWAATSLYGLGLFREDRVEVIDTAAGLTEGAALAILEDSRGDAWIGNRKGGVDRIRSGSLEHFTLPPSAGPGVISSIYEDRNGRIWVASREGPVFLWQGDGFVERFFGDTAPTRINAIYQDDQGTLWLGGRQGLLRSSGRLVTPVGPEANFPDGEVTCMSSGIDGELWLGTAEGFILRDSGGRFETIASPSNLAYRRVSAILVEAEDRVWVTTLGAGLFLYDGRKWRRFDRPEGLPDSRLTQVISDNLGHLWLGSIGGILRANRIDLLAHAANPESTIHWIRLDRLDGLPARECIGGHQPAGWRFKDGLIWFPTTLGIVRLDPSSTKVNRTPPPVFVHSASSNGGPSKIVDDKITAGPGTSSLSFDYHGLSFSAPEKLTYHTRLIGVDPSWRDVGSRRSTTYEAVPPGWYTFEVLALNSDGISSNAPTTIDIHVRPHFWQTGWFISQAIIFTLLLAGGIGWIIARARLKRRITLLKIRNAREAERSRIARDLHDDLGASLTEISLLADLGAEQAGDSSSEPLLSELSIKARAIGRTLDEIVWAVNPREDTIASLIDYLASFAGEFLEHAGVTLRIETPAELPTSPMDASLRHAIFLAARESFNNIAKHSHADTAWFRVRLENNILEILIEDNGCGIDLNIAHKGRGLRNFQARMQECGGSCAYLPRHGGGSVIRFLIPLLAKKPRHQ